MISCHLKVTSRLLSLKKRNDRLNEKDKIAEQTNSEPTRALTVSEGHSSSSTDEVVFTLNPEAPLLEPLGNGSDDGTGCVPVELEPQCRSGGEEESPAESKSEQESDASSDRSSYSDARSDMVHGNTDSEESTESARPVKTGEHPEH